jgi:hypothetical protein
LAEATGFGWLAAAGTLRQPEWENPGGLLPQEESFMAIINGDLRAEWKAGKERCKAQIAADKIKFKRDLGPELDSIGKLLQEAYKSEGAKLTAGLEKVKAQVKKCMEICKEYQTTLAGMKDATARGGLKNRLKNISDSLNDRYLESDEDYSRKMLERRMV